MDQTIALALDAAAEKYAERVAFVFRCGALSYRQLRQTSEELARGFLRLGVTKGDKVAIWMAGYAEWAYVYFALARIGAVMVAVNTRYRPDEIAYVLNKSRASLLVLKDEPNKNYLAILQELVPGAGDDVGITDDQGNTGYGYMPAMLLVGESPATAEALLHGMIAPLLRESEIVGIPDLTRQIDLAIGANPQLKFAVEEALLDLQGKRLQTPLYNLFGGLARRQVPVMRMLGLGPPKETAQEARALAERGYRYVKIKIGLDDKRDIETVKRTREALGEEVAISVDANQAYTPRRAVQVLNQLRDLNLIVCEQPVHQDDVRGMAFVRRHVEVPIMADEGVTTAADALRLIEADAVDAVSIKLWKMAGYYRSRDIAAVCSAANLGVHVGSTAGSQLMEALQLHFCAALPDLFAGAEIGEFESLTDDPAAGLTVENGRLCVSDRPGLGIDIDHDKLRETSGLWQPQ